MTLTLHPREACRVPGNGSSWQPFVQQLFACKWLKVLVPKCGYRSLTCFTWRTCTSSIYTTTYSQLIQEFAATRLMSATGLSTFVFGIAFGPLLSGPLSELFGRKRVYLVAWLTFIIFTIPPAVAQNMSTLIATRFFAGFGGSTFLSVSGGTVGDIFAKDELQKPMALVSLAPFIGPSLGPFLGGFINYHLHWRWTYYIMLVWAVLIFLAILFIPETFHPAACAAKARKIRIETGDMRYWAQSETTHQSSPKTIGLTLLRPFQLFFLEPMCFCLNIYSAILLGILYLFFGAVPQIFRTNYDMNLWQSGLTFLGIIIGMAFSVLTNPLWILIRSRLVARHREETGKDNTSEPEYQLPPAMVGGVLIPVGLFWFAWTIQATIHWVVPILGSSFFGFGLVLSPLTIRNMLTQRNFRVILVYNGIFTFLVCDLLLFRFAVTVMIAASRSVQGYFY